MSLKLEETIENIDKIDRLYMKEIKQIPLLSAEEEKELMLKVSIGDKTAKEKMIISNLRLVVSIVNKHLNSGIPFLDLVEEGNLGLIKAVDKYDFNKGIRFSTYATYWIENAIFKYIASNEKSVRIPLFTYNKAGSLRKTIATLSQELNREPTITEISSKNNLDPTTIMNLQEIQKFNMISINDLVSDENDKSLESIISNLEEPLEDIIIDSTLKDSILKLFIKCNLTEIEKKVLILRYGFDNSRRYTLEEIGKMYNITKQGINGIEKKAINKLRISNYIIDFAIYMQNPDNALRNLEFYRREYYKKVLKKE